MSHLEGFLVERGLLPHADGSAVCHLVGTSVIAAVYGPTETLGARDEPIDRAIIEVTYKPKVGSTVGCDGRVLEKFIRELCESVILLKLHPQARFIVSIQEVSNTGCLLACAANAVCMALLDACVPMSYTFAAIPCDVYDNGNVHLPSSKKIYKDSCVSSSHTFVLDSKYSMVLSNQSKGKGCVTDEDYDKSLNLCRQTSEDVFSEYNKLFKTKTVEGKTKKKKSAKS